MKWNYKNRKKKIPFRISTPMRLTRTHFLQAKIRTVTKEYTFFCVCVEDGANTMLLNFPLTSQTIP